ncbi:MAG: 3-beta-hydroxycholanate 3-dehydrogenase (NADP(+)) [Candidatus Celerinatantimonas neptuna]|nr:MAG: 3-beta-hydroxycholanate 3-dehydrogenase (NADP(+)) [Candidatus Celerinatantimonas neptuna]
MKRLAGKIALLTGASSGIGAGTAQRLAKEGATVILVARRLERLQKLKTKIQGEGGRALAIGGDVTSIEDCHNIFQETIEKFGRLDILVNNAGAGDHHQPITRVANDFWDKIIELNQKSIFTFCKEALKYMEPSGQGSIINISSIAGVYANAGAAYSTSKFAVIGLSKNIALQYAGTNIRCNVICPGPTPTEIFSPENMDKMDTAFADICARHSDLTVGQSTVEDQANAILFFASDESKSITGQVLIVDRGMCL